MPKENDVILEISYCQTS